MFIRGKKFTIFDDHSGRKSSQNDDFRGQFFVSSQKLTVLDVIPPAPTVSTGGKEPHFFLFFHLFRGPLLDWFRQIMLYSHWSTQTWCSKHARVPVTDEAVLYTLMTVELAMGF